MTVRRIFSKHFGFPLHSPLTPFVLMNFLRSFSLLNPFFPKHDFASRLTLEVWSWGLKNGIRNEYIDDGRDAGVVLRVLYIRTEGSLTFRKHPKFMNLQKWFMTLQRYRERPPLPILVLAFNFSEQMLSSNELMRSPGVIAIGIYLLQLTQDVDGRHMPGHVCAMSKDAKKFKMQNFENKYLKNYARLLRVISENVLWCFYAWRYYFHWHFRWMVESQASQIGSRSGVKEESAGVKTEERLIVPAQHPDYEKATASAAEGVWLGHTSFFCCSLILECHARGCF